MRKLKPTRHRIGCGVCVFGTNQWGIQAKMNIMGCFHLFARRFVRMSKLPVSWPHNFPLTGVLSPRGNLLVAQELA